MSMSLIVTCQSCRQKLRVPSERIEDLGHCARCGWSFRVKNSGRAVATHRRSTRLFSRRNWLMGMGIIVVGAGSWWFLDFPKNAPTPEAGQREDDYLPGIVPDGELVRVVCIGDSITAGNGLPNPSRDAYPVQLQTRLGAAFEVRSFAAPGRSILSNADFPYRQTFQYTEALRFLPHRAVILLGTNDGWPQNWHHEEAFSRDFAELLQSFRQLPSRPRLYLASPTPVFGSPSGELRDARIREIGSRIGREATRLKLPFVDLHAAFQQSKELFPDGIHPNREGAQLIAELLGQRIREDGIE